MTFIIVNFKDGIYTLAKSENEELNLTRILAFKSHRNFNSIPFEKWMLKQYKSIEKNIDGIFYTEIKLEDFFQESCNYYKFKKIKNYNTYHDCVHFFKGDILKLKERKNNVKN